MNIQEASEMQIAVLVVRSAERRAIIGLVVSAAIAIVPTSQAVDLLQVCLSAESESRL